MKNGTFKGRGIEDSAQLIKSGANQTLTVAVDIAMEDNGVGTSFLYFSKESAEYSFARLRALGWKGDDIRNLKGIGDNTVDVQVIEETYQGKRRQKVEIISGGGRFKAEDSQKVDPDEFAARLAAITGGAPPPAKKPDDEAFGGTAPDDDIPF